MNLKDQLVIFANQEIYEDPSIQEFEFEKEKLHDTEISYLVDDFTKNKSIVFTKVSGDSVSYFEMYPAEGACGKIGMTFINSNGYIFLKFYSLSDTFKLEKGDNIILLFDDGSTIDYNFEAPSRGQKYFYFNLKLLSKSDLEKFVTLNLKKVKLTSEKTGIKTVIPMHPVIREILIRRNNILPGPVSNQKMNKQLKVLGSMAGINEPVEITIMKLSCKERKIYKKYELISTHTARRSGCTNMYLAGIEVADIMNFSGHTTEKSFKKYIKASSQQVANKVKDHPFFNEKT